MPSTTINKTNPSSITLALPVSVTTIPLIHTNIAKNNIFEILVNFDVVFRGEGVEIAKK